MPASTAALITSPKNALCQRENERRHNDGLLNLAKEPNAGHIASVLTKCMQASMRPDAPE